MIKLNDNMLRNGSIFVIILSCLILVVYKPADEKVSVPQAMPKTSSVQSEPAPVFRYEPKSVPVGNPKVSIPSSGSYERTSPGYDSRAPLLPRYKGDVEPLYNEVQRLKERQGMTDAEAVDKILRDAGEIP